MGTELGIYIDYLTACHYQGQKPVSQKFFEKIRAREGIGLRKFDKFLSQDTVCLATYKRQLEGASDTGWEFFCFFNERS